MEFTVETQGANTYLVYQLANKDMVDTFSLGMLTNNRINHIIPVLFTQMDSFRYFKYNISAKTSVKEFFAGTVNKKRLLGVFSGISAALLAAEEYMIDPSCFLLDLSHIYVDVRTCAASLICLPLIRKSSVQIDYAAFFKDTIFKIQFDPGESGEYMSKLISYLNSNALFSLNEFKNALDELQRASAHDPDRGTQPVQPHPVQPHPVQPPVQQGPAAYSRPVQQPVWQPSPVQPFTQQQSVVGNVQGRPPSPSQPPVAPPPAQQGGVPLSAAQPWPGRPAPIPPGNPKPIPQPAQPMTSFAVPGVSPSMQEAPQAAQLEKQDDLYGNEKKMSRFYLLMHYSKENKEIFKAQKQSEKMAKQAKPPKMSKADKLDIVFNSAHQSPGRNGSMPNTNFAVPGQGAAPGANRPMPGSAGLMAPPTAGMRMPSAPPAQPGQPPAQAPPVQGRPASPSMPVHPQGYASAMGGDQANFGETTFLNEGGISETTVLTSHNESANQPFLIRRRTNEKVLIDKPVFRIGKEKSSADYFISDNTAISRSHANIVVRNGSYFIIDMNSTNSTYLNNSKLPSNTEIEIANGAILRLANEEFEFRTY